jgi:hypothetical protein
MVFCLASKVDCKFSISAIVVVPPPPLVEMLSILNLIHLFFVTKMSY